MDKIGANSLNNVNFNGNDVKKPQKEVKQEYSPKTGDLSAYLDNVGNSQRLLVKKSDSAPKQQQKLKEEEKFLKKHNVKLGDNSSETLANFHFLVGQIPMPKNENALDGKSLDSYKREKALDLLSRFEASIGELQQTSQGKDISELRQTAFDSLNM